MTGLGYCEAVIVSGQVTSVRSAVLTCSHSGHCEEVSGFGSGHLGGVYLNFEESILNFIKCQLVFTRLNGIVRTQPTRSSDRSIFDLFVDRLDAYRELFEHICVRYEM